MSRPAFTCPTTTAQSPPRAPAATSTTRLTANNEIPAFVALDSLDNVYVTGVGGPEVVAANGSRYMRMRMVTLKHSAGGALVWTIGAIEGGSGNVVRVGGDGSTLFVQGYGGMYTALPPDRRRGRRAAARAAARADELGPELE